MFGWRQPLVRRFAHAPELLDERVQVAVIHGA
jgi:hypothetical protein